MRRSQILAACTSFRSALAESGLTALFQAGRDNPAQVVKAEPERFMTSVMKFGQLAQGFDPATRELVRIFEFEFIQNPKWIVGVLGGDDKTAARNLFDFVFSMSLVENYLPKFADMLKVAAAAAPGEGVRQVLTVSIIEEPGEALPAERVSGVIRSIQDLHQAACRLTGVSDTLLLGACDSGADTTFEFSGAARPIEEVRSVILSMWDKVVFFREHRDPDRNRVIAETLPVLRELTAARDAGQLSAEEAEILRRQIVEAATRFLDAGATIPEIQGRAVYDARKLMAATTRLLSKPAEPAPAPAAPAAPADDRPAAAHRARSELTQEEIEGLQRFLNRQFRVE